MTRIFICFIFGLGRLLLRLRYKIKLINYHELFEKKLDKSGKILFLPNHPAEIDPIILFCLLSCKFKPRPLVVEHFFFLKGVSFFMKLVRAVPIPTFELSASKWKIKRADKAIDKVESEIVKGDNFIIYPGGQLRRIDHEIVGGNSLIHKLIANTPDIKPVLIRTTGLWGSSFSRALSGKLPDFWRTVGKGVLIILKNGIFFTPRRVVEIEFSLPNHKVSKDQTRLELNGYLENWYNQYRDDKGNISSNEPLKLVSFSRFKKEFPKVYPREKVVKEKKSFELPIKTRGEIYSEVSNLSGKAIDALEEDMDLSADLGLDSLDIAGLHAFLSEHYQVPKVRPGELKTIYDLFETAAGEKIPEQIQSEPFVSKTFWKEDPNRKSPMMPHGESIPEVFLRLCDRFGSSDACGDELTKVLSYKKLKLAALILAEKFKQFEGKHVGILLPASVGANLCILALLLARKIPVMLNWTSGKRALEHSVEITQMEVILTSMRFLDRLDNIDFGTLEDKFIMMEDVKRSVSITDKLKGLVLAKKSTSVLMRKLSIKDIHPNDIAVILFTSGTETLPKGVPLTHNNILSNLRAGFSCINVYPDDLLLGALPPFHSFGFTVTGLLPLLCGVKVFFAPDPTDGAALARIIEKHKPTFLCLAPSFYKYLFRVANPEQLSSVRLFVTGAEKASQEMFDYIKGLGGKRILIEGYGITECSPAVTISREEDPPIGVGKPIPGVELCIVHPETGKKLHSSSEGEICIKGPSVFGGYFGPGKPNPFIEINGEKWYRSGDIGLVDEEGYLIIKGRLKRFVKIGGEMVSLGAVEDLLSEWIKNQSWEPPLDEDKPFIALAAKEEEGTKTILMCVTTLSLDLDRVNQILRDGGFGSIVKISGIRKVDEIPLTGTGKVHFRLLNEMFEEK